MLLVISPDQLVFLPLQQKMGKIPQKCISLAHITPEGLLAHTLGGELAAQVVPVRSHPAVAACLRVLRAEVLARLVLPGLPPAVLASAPPAPPARLQRLVDLKHKHIRTPRSIYSYFDGISRSIISDTHR
jgi:hypothetical protein